MDWTEQASAMVDHYEGFLVPGMFAASAEILLEAVSVGTGDDVLDVACGSGIVSRTASARVGPQGSVVGVDVTPPMLERARSLGAPDGGAAIDYLEGDALELPVDDAAFDVVVCQHGLPFFPDKSRALAEMLRALRPGGRMGVACWEAIERMPARAAQERALREHVGATEAEALRMPYSLGPEAVERLLREIDVEDVSVRVVEVPTSFPGTPEDMALRSILATPVGARFATLASEVRDAFVAQVAGDVAQYDTGDGYLRPPTFASIATARKPT